MNGVLLLGMLIVGALTAVGFISLFLHLLGQGCFP